MAKLTQKLPRVFLLLVLFYKGISAESANDMDTLYKKLILDYNKEIRPNSNQSIPTMVNASFFLISLNEYEAKENKLVLSGGFRISWRDDRMTWNTSDYGGATDILFPSSDVWKPELLLVNPVEEFRLLSNVEIKVRYTNDGSAFWGASDLFMVACSADVTYYPHDTQNCNARFGPPYYNTREMIIQPANEEIDTRFYFDTGIWELKSGILTREVYQDIGAQYLILKFSIQRRSLFYVITLVAPIIIISFCNVLAFLIPPETGERVGFSVTILLSITVFMTIVSDILPMNSIPSLSILVVSIFVDLVVSTFITAVSIVSTRIHQRVDWNIPRWLRRLTMSCLCIKCCKAPRFHEIPVRFRRYKQAFVDPSNHTEQDSKGHTTVIDVKSGSMVINGRHKLNSNTELQKSDQDPQAEECGEQTADNLTWTEVGYVFDMFFLVVFTIMLATKCLVLLFLFPPS